jgi:diguanylate cyclase (GGDEF)-like protein/PAS domain S-box-containing protein
VADGPNDEHRGARHATATGSARDLWTSVGFDSTALETAPVAILGVTLAGTVCFWNRASEALFGWSADEVLGRPVPFVPPTSRPAAGGVIEQLLAGAPTVTGSFTPTRRDGHTFQMLSTSSLVRDEDGEPMLMITLARDVTADQEAVRVLEAAEHKWRQLALRSADTITLVDSHGHVLQSTGEARPTMGYEASWWRDKSGLELIHPDDLDEAAETWARLASTPGHRIRVVYRTRHRNGHYQLIEYTGVNLLEDPDVNGIVIAGRDVSAQKQAELLLADEARILEMIVQDASLDDVLAEIVRVVDHHTAGETGIFLLDRATETIVGRSTGRLDPAMVRLIERTPTDFAAEITNDHDADPAPDGVVSDESATVTSGSESASESGPPQAETEAEAGSESVTGRRWGRPRSESGDRPPFPRFPVGGPITIADYATDERTRDYAQPVIDLGYRSAWGVPVMEHRARRLFGFIGTYMRQAREPTRHERRVQERGSHLAAIAVERASWQHELFQQARYDVLTGLPNRAAIFDTLEEALTAARLHTHTTTTMLIDLDRFKVVNDSLGHEMGDLLIVEFAKRLRSVLDPDEFVGRMGADEFVVIFPADTTTDEGYDCAVRVARALDEPFVIDDDAVYLTCSIGLATSRGGAERADMLLQQADMAMFRAKSLGRARTVVFDEGLRSRTLDRLQIDRDLRLAVERTEFILHYQPEVDCRTGRIVGTEALLRWDHPTRGIIAPDDFIHAAEDNGVIVPIGYWVLDEAVKQARLWTEAIEGLDPFMVNVNLSARQLLNRGLVDTVAFVLTRYNWPPSHLTLELTESIVIEDQDATLSVLRRLRQLGVRLAIDDFGTGFASLDYLQRLHVDMIKIDRTFVTPLDADGNGSPVAAAMLSMADAFDLTVCAEGVETAEQLAGLRALGCDLAQGFLMSRPIPPSALEMLLRTNPRW